MPQQSPPNIPPVVTLFQQVMAGIQALQNQGGVKSGDINMKVHPVSAMDKKGNRIQISKTLPQIIADLDLSIQDLTMAVDDLTDILGSESNRRKRKERSNKIRAQG